MASIPFAAYKAGSIHENMRKAMRSRASSGSSVPQKTTPAIPLKPKSESFSERGPGGVFDNLRKLVLSKRSSSDESV